MMDADIKFSGLFVEKIVFEARYEESIMFQDIHTQNNSYKRLKKLFPQIVRSEEGGYVFVNQKEKNKITILPNRTAIEDDSHCSLIQFKGYALGSIDSAVNVLDVQEFNRVGLRVFYALTTESSKEAANIIVKKLKSLGEIFTGYDANNKVRLGYTYSKEGYTYNINIRPNSEAVFEGDVENGVTSASIKNQLVIDVDVFSDLTINITALNGFFNSAKEKSFDVAGNTKSWLFSGVE